MRATLALLLLAAGVCAAQAASAGMSPAGRRLLQVPTICPIANCKDASSCVYDSAKRSWTCRVCLPPLIPNAAKNACVCPAGQYPVAGGKCALCKLNFYCPLGTDPIKSTATRCPVNMVTLKRGAKSMFDCLNAPGFKYLKTVSSVRAVSCGDDEYSVGLAKQTACNKCPPGFETDPDDAPGSHTSSAVCLAPPGKFVTGESTSPCPVGEFSDSYSNATSCTTCEEALGSAGVTTEATGSLSKAYCNWPLPGYVLLDDKKKVILTYFDPNPANPTKIVTGAKLCPQSYYCQGGNPNRITGVDQPGVPVACFSSPATLSTLARLWTESEGATSATQCVAPPGHFYTANVAPTPPTITKCAANSYKVGFGNDDACTACGTGLWIADENSFINQLDAYGAVSKSIGTRGGPDVCYIQKGMGAVRDGTIGSSLKAILCPKDTYGVVNKKYGLVVTPCTPCPTSLVTAAALKTDATIKAQSYTSVSGTTTVTTYIPATETGFFNVDACQSLPGYGYYNGASQQCPKGWYNDADNTQPCKQCPYGKTTAGVASSSEDDCSGYLAGYGLVNDVTALCPLGTFQVEDGTGACETCTGNHWTPAPGGVEDYAATPEVAGSITCNLCQPGYYSTDSGATCNPCVDGYYCPASRTGSDVSATACPTGRTYTYTWETTEVYEPPATSVTTAQAPDECLALFSQTMDQSSFLNFAYDYASTENPLDATAVGLSSCVQSCYEDTSADCMAIIFSYNATEPECRKVKKGAGAADEGYGWKTMPSTNLAQSAAVAKLGAKAMGTGYYTYWNGFKNTELDTIKGVSTGATTIAACETSCTNNPLCAGIKYVKLSLASLPTITDCYQILASSAINTNKRTLIMAKYTQIGYDYATTCTAGKYLSGGKCLACGAGYYSDGSACVECPDGTTSTDPPTANCVLSVGYFYTGDAPANPPNSVEACAADAGSSCAGGATIAGGLSDTDAVGEAAACGTGEYSVGGQAPCMACPTNSDSTTTPSANCQLNNGFYYDGNGDDTVKSCPAGSVCAGGATFPGARTGTTDVGIVACGVSEYSTGGTAACSPCPANSVATSPPSGQCALNANYFYKALITTVTACTGTTTAAAGTPFTPGDNEDDVVPSAPGDTCTTT